MDPVTIREFEPDLEFRDAAVFDGFPSVGLVSTIVANYLIETFRLKQVGVMDHPMFPTLSVVHEGEPLSPVRIYAGDVDGADGKSVRLVVFASEFQPPPPLVRPVAEAIIKWAREKQCAHVISPEGLAVEDTDVPPDDEPEPRLHALASTPSLRARFEPLGVEAFQKGIVIGVCGVLLNLGKWNDFPVLAVLAEAHTNYPDARSAAGIIKLVGRFLGLTVDTAPLLRQAERFEDQVKMLQRRATAEPTRDLPPFPGMYG